MKNKKTLYVSDLDGTLLNNDKKITKFTAQVLKSRIEEGMLFTVATARMPYGCDYRLEELHLRTPGIVTNGVFLYDFSKKKNISAQTISMEAANKVIDAFRSVNLTCFVYMYNNEDISIFYDNKKLEEQTQYYSERARKSCIEVSLCHDVKEQLQKGEVCYLTFTGEKELIERVCCILNAIEEISYAFYLNIYNGLYCIEVFSKSASKKNALRKLMEIVQCEELVVFGDNLNDLSMIEIADRSYAPSNGLEEVKERVTGVLEDCDHDGVAKFLEAEWKIALNPKNNQYDPEVEIIKN